MLELDLLILVPILTATFLGAFAHLLFKIGATIGRETGILGMIFNVNTIAGIALFGVSTILYIYALSRAELSKLAPLIALTYLWVAFLSVAILGESISVLRWIGIILVIIGLILVIGF